MSQTFSSDFFNQVLDLITMTDNLKTATSNFGKLLENGKFSDVRLVVGDKEFRAHKNILSARSKIFSAMFENNMQEMNNSVVEITDINYQVMHHVLVFIYTGLADVTENLALDILYAADKYEIHGLKILCEKTLIKKISIENVGEMLITAERFNTEDLKRHLFEFIRDNSDDVRKNEACNSALKQLSINTLINFYKSVTKSK